MVKISDDAREVLRQAGTGAEQYVLSQGGFGGRLTSGEARRLLAGFNPMSGASVVGAVSNPWGIPDFSDPFGARTAIGERLGLPGAITKEQEARESLSGFQTTTREMINKLRANRGLSAGLEAGFEAKRTREAAVEEQALVDTLGISQQQRQVLEGQVSEDFAIFQRELDTRRGLMAQALQYGDTGVNINMSVGELTRRAAKAQEKAEKEARKQAKKDAFDDLFVQTFGHDRGKLSRKEAQRKMKKRIKSDREYEEQLRELELENTRSLIRTREKEEEDDDDFDFLDEASGASGTSGAGSWLSRLGEWGAGKAKDWYNKYKWW